MIFDADHLSNDAQQSLRRTMETGSETCRFILFSNNPCSLIQPIRSRCVMVRIPLPTKDEMVNIVSKIGGNEKIVAISRGNILHAEAAAFEYRITKNIENLFWKERIAQIAIDLRKKITTQDLEKKRDEFVELLTIVSPDTLMKTFFMNLMESNIVPEKKVKIPEIAMKHGRNMSMGYEPIYHMEAFLFEIAALLQQ